jgi:hypothetical protein
MPIAGRLMLVAATYVAIAASGWRALDMPLRNLTAFAVRRMRMSYAYLACYRRAQRIRPAGVVDLYD